MLEDQRRKGAVGVDPIRTLLASAFGGQKWPRPLVARLYIEQQNQELSLIKSHAKYERMAISPKGPPHLCVEPGAGIAGILLY